MQCLEQGAALDRVISQSKSQALDLWRYREGISEAITPFHRGSISAEHGIGLLKRDYLSYSRSEGDIERMRELCAILQACPVQVDPESTTNYDAVH